MTDVQWQIPPSMLRLFDQSPTDRAVVVLLRHSVRDNLPPGDAGNDLPITDAGGVAPVWTGHPANDRR